jgi:hypothetical protein
VGTTLTIPLNGATPADARMAIERAGLTAGAVTARRPTLDDVYLRLTGADPAAAA